MSRSSFAGRRLAVLGAGVSGLAAAEALRDEGAAVTIFDDRADRGEPPGSFAAARFDALVTSPGFAPTTPALRAAQAAGIPVLSEVELAWQLRARPQAPWLCVTGTNGKTTTVQLLEAMLDAGGERAQAAGNVGVPIVKAARDETIDVFAVELSSFQLHFTSSLRAESAALLNIAADHLDWHGSMSAYAAAKARIFTGCRQARVFNAADPLTEQLARAASATNSHLISFTHREPTVGQLGVVGDELVDRAVTSAAGAPIASFADLRGWTGEGNRPADHQLDNALAAAALALAHGVDIDAIRTALRDFTLGAHRLQLVRELDGVRYVDDSKATNAHAADAALGSVRAGTAVWIAGGLAKGARFEDLIERRADKLRAVVLIGKDVAELTQALGRHAAAIPVSRIDPGETGTVMQRAVDEARQLARPGDTVLLAPACASMDQFVSYAERGDAFEATVAALAE